MAGLLDVFNSFEGQQALGLLAAAGGRSDGAGFGQRLMEGLSQGDKWKAQQAAEKRAQMQEQMQQMQMQEYQAKVEEQKKMRGLAAKFAMPAVGMAADGYGPSAPASFDRQGYASALEAVDPIAGMQYAASIQKQKPALINVAEGSTLFDPEMQRAVYTSPKPKKEVDPNKPFTLGPNGEFLPNTEYQNYELKRAKSGANNTSVNIAGPENKFNQDIGAGLAKDALTLVDMARGAPSAISNARAIKSALDSGAITGTGADARLAVQKALETAGILGEGKAASTQQLMSGLSKLTLDGIKSSGLGGGNGFTNADREFLQSAISGTIADTPDNLRRVANLQEKVATISHTKGTQVLGRWQKNPALAGFAQDITIDALPQEQPTTAPKSNLINELPKTAPVGARAKDTTTGQIMRFDGMKWKPE